MDNKMQSIMVLDRLPRTDSMHRWGYIARRRGVLPPTLKYRSMAADTTPLTPTNPSRPYRRSFSDSNHHLWRMSVDDGGQLIHEPTLPSQQVSTELRLQPSRCPLPNHMHRAHRTSLAPSKCPTFIQSSMSTDRRRCCANAQMSHPPKL